MNNLSRKCKKYIKWVEKKTRLKVNINWEIKARPDGGRAWTQPAPDCINVWIVNDKKTTQNEIEQSIAHEITHNYLWHKKKYQIVNIINEKERRNINLIITAIEDIPVNFFIQNKGFSPFSPNYIDMVKREIDSMRNNEYGSHIQDEKYKNVLMINRYIFAWSFIKFFDIEINNKKILKEFIYEFNKKYTDILPQIKQIQDVFLENDIFTSKGHKIIISSVLENFNFNNLIKIRGICE